MSERFINHAETNLDSAAGICDGVFSHAYELFYRGRPEYLDVVGGLYEAVRLRCEDVGFDLQIFRPLLYVNIPDNLTHKVIPILTDNQPIPHKDMGILHDDPKNLYRLDDDDRPAEMVGIEEKDLILEYIQNSRLVPPM